MGTSLTYYPCLLRVRASECSRRLAVDRRKGPRLRLDPEAYRELCYEALERDGWSCQACGRMQDLQVHHIQPRSRLRDDSAENLIALCVKIHRHGHI